MQRFRSRDGFTLIELVFILAIVGILATMAIGALRSYGRREDARRAARSVAGVLEQARSQALASGRMTWVVFKEPVNGIAPFDANEFAAVIWDSDNDQKPTAADAVTPFSLPVGPREHTSVFGATSPFSDAVLPDLDNSRAVPDGQLAKTVDTDGSTLDVDPTLGVPAIGFNAQGLPVRVADPADLGSGAGGIYMTDNEASVVAVVVLPLGDVRTLAWDSANGSWK